MFEVGQQVTVTDGGWTGTIERIDAEIQSAWIRFPDHPALTPYAFEAIELARQGMFDLFTSRQLEDLYREAAERETAAYVACSLWRDQHPVTSIAAEPDYGILTAAADQACELRRALYAEITRRDRETVNA